MKLIWLLYSFFFIFIVVGVGMSAYTLRVIAKASSVSKWPVVDARVVNCEFESKSDSEGGASYEVKVEYSYSVNGQVYTGERLHPAYSSSSFGEPQLRFQPPFFFSPFFFSNGNGGASPITGL